MTPSVSWRECPSWGKSPVLSACTKKYGELRVTSHAKSKQKQRSGSLLTSRCFCFWLYSVRPTDTLDSRQWNKCGSSFATHLWIECMARNVRGVVTPTNAHGGRNILLRCEVSRWEFSDEKWVAVLIRTGTAPVAIHGNIRMPWTSCSLHPVFQHFSRKCHHLPTNIFGMTFRPPWAFCLLIPLKSIE